MRSRFFCRLSARASSVSSWRVLIPRKLLKVVVKHGLDLVARPALNLDKVGDVILFLSVVVGELSQGFYQGRNLETVEPRVDFVDLALFRSGVSFFHDGIDLASSIRAEFVRSRRVRGVRVVINVVAAPLCGDDQEASARSLSLFSEYLRKVPADRPSCFAI